MAIHNSANSNAGDSLLVSKTKRVFEARFGPIRWIDIPVWDSFDQEYVRLVNENCDMVVVGGGGLFLRDQAGAEASISGWQWNIAPEVIQQITPPLVVFAVGYNRFRGQQDFDPHFSDSVQALVTRGAFSGIRNSGSIAALGAYLTSGQAEKLRLQPCPTLLARWLDAPAIAAQRAKESSRSVFLNAAYDRSQMRLGDRSSELDQAYVNVALWAQREGRDVVVVAHKSDDLQICGPLSTHGVNYSSIDLTGSDETTIQQTYLGADLVVGMRGHAQMIPFGLGVPILSVVTHDKMRWFLNDWGEPEWGVDISEGSFTEILLTRARELTADADHIRAAIEHRLEVIKLLTETNLDAIECHI